MRRHAARVSYPLSANFDGNPLNVMITMQMRYTPENLQRAFSVHYRKNNWVRGHILLILGFLLLWAGLLLWVIYRNQEQRIIQYVYLISGVLLIAMHWFLMNRLGRLTYKRLQSPQGSFTFNIGDELIEMITNNGVYDVEWERVDRAIVLPDIVLVYVGKQQFYFFPKRNFDSAQDFEAVQEMVVQKVPKVIR